MVTLNKPVAGDTDWTAEINDNWTTLDQQVGAALEVDTWRLEFTSATTLTLVGTGEGGGKITIQAEGVSFAANPTVTNAGLAANTLHRVYARKSGTTAALEISTTAADREEYGTYGKKTGDATRRLVGLVFTDGSSQFTSAMTRSNRNEPGYAQRKEVEDQLNLTTTSTTYVDIHASFSLFGLFWDKERVWVWGRLLANIQDAAANRLVTAAMSFGGTDLTGGESGLYLENVSADVVRTFVLPEDYVTNSGAGRKEVKVRWKTLTGFTAQMRATSAQVNGLGLEVVR